VGPKRKTDRNARNRNADAWDWRYGARGPPRRGSGSGLLMFGVLCGVAAGYLLTDPTAWRGLKRAAGFPVAERPQVTGRPTQITDGDTFRLGGKRIRLLGVDAPEMSTPDGQFARAHLATLILVNPGPLRCEDTGQRTYQRIVAQCFTADGQDLSALMAENGWATVMPRFGGLPYAPEQLRAMWTGQGMWNGMWERATRR
jgi:endonuclease YncB( thermonuclease family)